MKIWQAYKTTIIKNCSGTSAQLHGLPYWSNRLFATMMLYLFPLFLFALVPGVYMSIVSNLYQLAFFDIFIVISIAASALLPGLSINVRKGWFIGLLYTLAIGLLYYLGWFGPGLVYLLAITLFCLLIFHGEHAFFTVYVNTAVCISVGICVHFHLLRSGIGLQYTLGSWIAVSVNLVILCAVMAILLPMLFNGLQQSNNRYETVARATTDTIWDWDIAHDSISYNYGMREIFGHPLNEVKNVNKWLKTKLHAADLGLINEQINQALKKGDTLLQLSYRFLCADGKYKHVLDRAFIVRDPTTGVPVKVIGAMQDITRQKEEEQWLRLTESALRYATDAVVIVEAEPDNMHQRKIVYVNEAFTYITGYSQWEVTDTFTNILWGANNQLPDTGEMIDTFEQNGPFEVEVINYKKNGERYWSSKSVSPVKDNTGKTTHWISIERDVTQLKDHVSAVEKQNIQLKEIAWTQAHIVRAPVARVMGLTNLLGDHLNHNPDAAELVSFINISALELDNIVREIIKKSE
ncbi:PAS domain S-box-containing protein [Mucilaginibacter gossypiicola]|uniref:histidine kinase n=1 Tax=Mucilaginibacter gossypiicola TaxID=551995 RepID=A0A1H8JEQ0_9SPHI|nr:PAS domain S-box protein [Mucilaginibacter gossypiicola]SEN78668.1 PAS domain S-box-containing protein [Mucilaginibacter gossypiicola]